MNFKLVSARCFTAGLGFLTVSACGAKRSTSPSPAPGVALAEASQLQGKTAATNWVLPIPAREQWENGHGYCGETSLQSIGLYYGAWISQGLVRDVGDGEALLGVNFDQAMDALHLQYDEWDESGSYRDYMVWLKQSLAQRWPVVFAAFVADGDNSVYDHIMPAVGVIARQSNPDVYDPNDQLVFATNFTRKLLTLSFDEVGATRRRCQRDTLHGGCIPQKGDFGVAISGIIDQGHATLPVQLSVERWDEPNTSLGADSADLYGTVQVSSLQPGHKYALLRYDDYTKVPTTGDAQAFLNSHFAKRTDFTATGTTWSARDGEAFDSSGAVYYRCVPL